MKIIFFLRAGVVEWQIPNELHATFHFASAVTNMRVNGFFLGENIYIRHEEMTGMAFVTGDAKPPVFKSEVSGTLQ